ncbi:hypothetical protein L218DRAFT_949027 [Marasmius fiardii PR-910]|nr:hypothetical protein L218DRAFT_949027 [Marasmius fiardii PR-910]
MESHFLELHDALGLVTPELKENLVLASRRMQKNRGRAFRKVKGLEEDKESSRRRSESCGWFNRPRTKTPAAATAAQGEELNGSTAGEGKGGIRKVDQSFWEEQCRCWPEGSLRIRMLLIATHGGAAVDPGHYIGFMKKTVFHGPPLRCLPHQKSRILVHMKTTRIGTSLIILKLLATAGSEVTKLGKW